MAITAFGDVLGPAGKGVQQLRTQAQQIRRGGHLGGQCGVVELFARPGRFAVGIQPHHARTALQGVEGTAHGRHGRQVIRGRLQLGQGRTGITDHLLSFLQEDAAHFVIFFQAGGFHGRRGLRHQGSQHDGFRLGLRLGFGGDFSNHQFNLLFGLRQGFGVVRLLQLGLGQAEGLGQFGLVLHHRGVGQALQFLLQHLGGGVLLQHLRDVFGHGLSFGTLHGVHMLHGRLDRIIRGQDACFFFPAHQGRQQARFGVKGEQVARQRRLHAHHVHQEAQRTQVGGQAVEDPGLSGRINVQIIAQQVVDVLAHAHRRLNSHVQPQHGQHTTHALQLGGHRHQRMPLGRLAEELVDLLFALGQGGAQFLHHTAHGLAVGDPAVQVFHPRFERSRLGTGARLADALGQAAHAVLLLRVIELAVFQAGLEVQDGGGHFHGQGGLRRLGRAHGLSHGIAQSLGQYIAGGIESVERITHQAELLVQAANAQKLAARHSRPPFFGARHTLDGLLDDTGVVLAQG